MRRKVQRARWGTHGAPPSLTLHKGCTSRKRLPANSAHMTPTACTQSFHTLPRFLTRVLVRALLLAQDGDIWCAGGGGKMELEQSAPIPDCSPPHPFTRKEERKGRGRGPYA